MTARSDLPDTENLSAQECGIHGEALLVAGRWRDAERFFLAQLEKGKREFNLDQQAKANGSLAHLCRYKGDGAQALTLYRRALFQAEQVNNRRLIGTIYNEIGEVYRVQGDNGEAVKYYNLSLEIATALNGEEDLAVVYGNLGIIYKNQGELEQAARAYEKSLQYSLKQGIERLTANQYGNLANVYTLQKHYQQAIEMQQKCLEICLRQGYLPTAANTYGNLGSIHQMLGDYPTALQMYRHALDMMQAIGNEQGKALTYGNLAVVYQQLGDREQALANYDRALEILERIGDKHNTAKYYNNRGLFHHQLGQVTEARACLQRSLTLFEEVGDRESAQEVRQSLQKLEAIIARSAAARPAATPSQTLPDEGAHQLQMRILGKCRPAEPFGCRTPLDAQALGSVADSVLLMARGGVAIQIILGQFQTPPPPGLGRLFNEIIDLPENRRYGLYHLKDLQIIVLKSTTLAEAMRRHLFAPGEPYFMLVRAINLLGLEAVDVEVY